MKCKNCKKEITKSVYMYNDNSYCSDTHRDIAIYRFETKPKKNDNTFLNNISSYLIIKVNP